MAALLLFESAPDMYMRFSGGRERALATLERAFDEPGNLASGDVAWVAELDGRPAAVMAGFPVVQAALRSRAYLGLTLRGTPFWRWPGVLRLYWLGGRASPAPRKDSFYIDALATDPEFRRRGLARALLDEAERQARCARAAGCEPRHHDEQRDRARPIRERRLRRGRLPAAQPPAARLRRPGQAAAPMTARSASTTCSTSPSVRSG